MGEAAWSAGPDRPWRPGDVVLGLYDVLDVVASGAMGLVYRVRHRGWNIELAVKAPRPEFVATERGRVAFEHEAEAWMALGLHPHVVSCAYVRRLGAVPRVFAEWVDGGSLAEAVRSRRLYQGGPAEALRRVLDVAIQFAWGLEHAHRSGLVHQDVKPANVMLTRGGTVKVTDFGLARARMVAGGPTPAAAAAVGAAAAPAGTVLVTYGGLTPAYCSPEQADAAAGRYVRVSRATDIWSWAVSVLDLFTGGPPARYGHLADAALESFVGRPPANRPRATGPADIPPALPSAVADLLRRCLARRPADRPSRMEQVAEELVALYSEVIGEPYPRERPSAVRMLADGLSNQALSLLDLGRAEQAEALWEQALRADPRHAHAVYNRGLHRWRTGACTDLQLVAELADIRAGNRRQHWLDDHLLGLVHLERGDPGSAEPLLATAAARSGASGSPHGPGGPDPQVARALASARRAAPVPVARILAGHRNPVQAVAVSGDGRRVAAATADPSRPTGPGHAAEIRVWDVDGGAAAAPDAAAPDAAAPDAAGGRCVAVLPGHAGTIGTVALDGAGRVLVSGGDDGSVVVWDVDSGRPLHRFGEHSLRVRSVAVSQDGTTAASVADDGTFLVWDVAGGRLARALRRRRVDHSHGEQVAVSADGRRVVHWEPGTNRLRVWDAAAGQLLHSVQFHRMTGLLGPGGRVGVVDGEGRTQVWDTVAARELRTLAVTRRFGAVSGDGRRAVMSVAGGVEVWDLAAGRCLRTLPGPGGTLPGPGDAVLALDDAGEVAACGQGTSVLVWRTAGPSVALSPWSYARPRDAGEASREAGAVQLAARRGERLAGEGRWAEAAGELRAARGVAGHERDADLLTRWAAVGRHGRRTGLLGAWHLRDLRDPPAGLSDQLGIAAGTRSDYSPLVAGGFALSPDGRLALSRQHSSAALVDVATGERRHRLSTFGPQVRCVGFTPDSRFALTGGDDGSLLVWEVESGQRLFALDDHPAAVEAVTSSVDGRLLVTGCRDGTLKVWDTVTRRCLRTMRDSPRFVTGLTLGADARFLVSHEFEVVGGLESLHFAFVWELPRNAPPATVPCWVTSAHTTRVGPGGCLGISASSTASALRLFDPPTGELRGMLLCGREPLTRIEMSQDGQLAVAATSAGSLWVWDLAGADDGGWHEPRHRLTGHDGAVTALGLTTDGRFALSGGADGTVRVWDLAEGSCLRSLSAHRGPVRAVLASADARTLLSLGEDGRVRAWQLDWDHAFPAAADWDESARWHLDAFLRRHRWRGAEWTNEDVERLLAGLQDAGLGWIRPAGIRAELARADQQQPEGTW
ncbi:protein kinase [Frankia sp. Cpl3]|uniref:protein kinase domain-containing protein n=1 Tax=Parafrankia colletiae TaxID=573497 RepID=UPI0010425BA3|nr:protein kinase [Parafrankia colletiae]MCK9902826.1 protein kinase [Frankia sp. Cpl3]